MTIVALRHGLAVLGVTGAFAGDFSGQAHAQTMPPRIELQTYEATVPQRLVAQREREYVAPEARQGVAVEERHFYAGVTSLIAQYERATGERLGYWSSPRGGLIRHINSCLSDQGKLWCANSNFPETPMASSVEVIDSRTMSHVASHSLGLTEEGSLTFFDRLGEGWMAGFAHYDGEGGHTFKPARFSGIALYDGLWRRTGGYALPATVLERMAPHAASGGAFGPDGLLYLMGHDLPELYVLAKPSMGPVLIHVATIEMDVAGQAFSWDKTDSATRRIFAINRPTGSVRVFSIPEVILSDRDARPFF